jgi:hypothetical protein
MEERGVAMAFQAEHALFPPLQEKRVRRSVRHVTARASLNTTGQMFKGEWAAFLDMAPSAGLVVYTAEGKTTLAAVRCMAVGAAQGAFQNLVMHREGKSTPHLPVTGEAQLGRLLPQQASGHRREMRRMTVVTRNPRQLMLTTPELEPLGFFLVASEADLRPGLGRFVVKGHQSSHPLATPSSHVGFTGAMTGLAPPRCRGFWGDLLEELGMGSGTKIFRQVAMASYTDLRPDISALLLLRRSRCLLPLHKTPSHYRSKEC